MDKIEATSTPLRANLRRMSILNSMVLSPLRRSNIGPPNPSSVLKPANEEEEILTRRSMVTMQRRLTENYNTGSPLGDVSLPLEEIQSHLQICRKLYMENKISAKNAWHIRVIDIMTKILSNDDDNIFQIAGSSLDIGARVYGVRVDDIYARGLQLASAMSKSNEVKQTEERGEDLNLEAEVQRRRVKKKTKKMAADKRNTIDKEGKSLFCPHKHTESVVFATKENIDIGAIDNLFTQKLPTNPSDHEFVVLSKNKFWSNEPDSALSKMNKEIEIEMPNIGNYNICAPFKDFEIGFWDPAEEEKGLAETPNLPEAVLDENGVPIAELDGSINDIFDDNHEEQHVSDDEEQEVVQAQIHGGIDHIVDAIPEENRVQTEYGYNTLLRTTSGRQIDKIWAGPSHWKVKYNRPSSVRFSGATQKVVKHKKKARVPPPIDFANEVLEDLFPTLPKYVPKGKPKSAPFEKVTLPVQDLLDDFNTQIEHLFLKTSLKRPVYKSPQKSHDFEVPVYNYENPNDSHYCSQNNSDGADNEPMADGSFEEVPPTAQEFLEDNLVSAPETVAPIHVPYSLHAKKMDMKKLKSAIWKSLTGNSEAIEGKTNGQIQPTLFSSMYHSLPQMLPGDMKKELSCPLALVALLHLCNENNLKLIQGEDIKDFTIIKP